MSKGRGTGGVVKKLAFLRHSSKKIFIAICIFTFILLFVLSWKRLNGEAPRFTQHGSRDASDWTKSQEETPSEKDSPSSREKDSRNSREKDSRNSREKDSSISQTTDTLSARLNTFLHLRKTKDSSSLLKNAGGDSNDDGNHNDEDDRDVNDAEVEKLPPVIQIENHSASEADKNLHPEISDKSLQLQSAGWERRDKQLSSRKHAPERTEKELRKHYPDETNSREEDGSLFVPRQDTQQSAGKNELQDAGQEARGGFNKLRPDTGPASGRSLLSPGNRPRNPKTPTEIQSRRAEDADTASNYTMLREVAMHDKLLKALQARVEKLKEFDTKHAGLGKENKVLLQLLTGRGGDDGAGDGENRETGENNGGGGNSDLVRNEKLRENERIFDRARPSSPYSAVVESIAKVGDAGSKKTEDVGANLEKPEDVKPDEKTAERPDSCQGCFKTNFPVLIDQNNYCRGMSQQPIVMLLIASAPNNADRRQAIRETWGAKCQDPSSTYRCLFVLGEDTDAHVNEDLKLENGKYRDILQFGFQDAYYNLTYKTMASLRWADRNCPSVPYLMKTDDDMYINTELIPVMLTAAPTTGFFGGFCWGISNPNRNSQTKWYVSFDMYKKPKFPAMCSGTGYILSRDVVRHVIHASRDVPFFHLEDVYVALCLRNFNAPPRRIRGFNNMFTTFDACQYRNYVMSSHQVSPSDLRFYWTQMLQCPKQNFTGNQLFTEIGYPATR